MIVQRVSFPILVEIKDKPKKLKTTFKKILNLMMLLNLSVMLSIWSVSNDLPVVLFGPQWKESTLFLNYLIIVGIFFPLHSLNLTLLNTIGRTDLFLKLEIYKRALTIPAIFIGWYFNSLSVLLVLIVLNNLISFVLNSKWSGSSINYSTLDQLKDILPLVLILLIPSTFFKYLFEFLIDHQYLKMFLTLSCYMTSGIFFIKVFSANLFYELKSIVFKELKWEK